MCSRFSVQKKRNEYNMKTNPPNANSVQIFNNPQFGELRTSENESNVFFCLNDVMKSLGLNHVTNLKKRLNEKGCTTITVGVTTGTKQDDSPALQNVSMIFIDEPNLYRCIFQSRKKEAQQFQDWVAEEVLPAIRKSGGYIQSQPDETPEMIMARALKVADQTLQRNAERVRQLESEIEDVEFKLAIASGEAEELKQINSKMLPKAEYTEQVLQSTNTYTFTQVAKSLGLRSVYVLENLLKDKKVIYKQSGQWMPVAQYADKKYFATRTHRYIKSDETIGTTISTVITERGRAWIHYMFFKVEGQA